MAREWHGSDWGNSGNALGGLRLMVLGESHHHASEPIGTDMPHMTEYVVNSYLENSRKFSFLGRIERLMMHGQEPCKSEQFWNSVVFYNYVPVVAANRPRQRPPEHLWYGQAPQLFLDLVKKVEAEAILVCGTELWRRMAMGLVETSSAYRAGGRSWREREYEVALPYRAIAAHIPHPSGSFGWSYDRCLPVVRHLRSRVDEMRAELGNDAVNATTMSSD